VPVGVRAVLLAIVQGLTPSEAETGEPLELMRQETVVEVKKPMPEIDPPLGAFN
jgi:hypothetical protein